MAEAKKLLISYQEAEISCLAKKPRRRKVQQRARALKLWLTPRSQEEKKVKGYKYKKVFTDSYSDTEGSTTATCNFIETEDFSPSKKEEHHQQEAY